MVPDVVKLPVTRLTSEWPQPAIYAHEYERRMLDEEENEKRRTASTVQSTASLPFGRSIQWRDEKELTALLQQKVTCGGSGAPIVIVGVL